MGVVANEERMPDETEFDPSLPEYCYSRLLTDSMLILIRRGDRGYYPSHGGTVKANDEIVDELNANRGITKAQRMAMETGSMFGWSVPGAFASAWENRV